MILHIPYLFPCIFAKCCRTLFHRRQSMCLFFCYIYNQCCNLANENMDINKDNKHKNFGILLTQHSTYVVMCCSKPWKIHIIISKKRRVIEFIAKLVLPDSTMCPFIFACPWFGVKPIHLQTIYLFYSCQARRGGGSEERCDHGEAIYHVFKIWLLKIKYYNLYNIQNYFSATKLIYSHNINYCRVVKIGRFIRSVNPVQASLRLTEEIYLTFDILH